MHGCASELQLKHVIIATGDADSGAPGAAVHKNQSAGVLDTTNSFVEKAQAQLDGARAKEIADI